MKRRRKKRPVELKPSDLVTVGKYNEFNEYICSKEYIIGYYKATHKKRDVVSLDIPLIATISKNKVYNIKGLHFKLLDVESAKYTGYAKRQLFWYSLKKAFQKLIRKN